MLEQITYIAIDGTQFEDRAECLKHEGRELCESCGGLGTTLTPIGNPERLILDCREEKCTTCQGHGYAAIIQKLQMSAGKCAYSNPYTGAITIERHERTIEYSIEEVVALHAMFERVIADLNYIHQPEPE